MPPAVIEAPIKDVLDKLSFFMRVVDEAANVGCIKYSKNYGCSLRIQVHPYAKLAWDVLSAAHRVSNIMLNMCSDERLNTLPYYY